MTTEITLPTVLGFIADPTGGGNDLCLPGHEADLLLLGATIGGCTTPTTPDSDVNVDDDSTDVDLDDPYGDPETNELCTGGGTFTWGAADYLTISTSCPRDKPGIGTGNYTDAEQRNICFAKALALIRSVCIAQGGITGDIDGCDVVTCTTTCEPDGGVWDHQERITIEQKRRQVYNTGTSTEHTTYTWKITHQAAVDITVTCVCQ